MLGHEPGALEHVLEVPLRQPLALRDHAEAVRARRPRPPARARGSARGVIIACIGVSASAKRDCAQKPQSSAQPPDLAFTSEHMSVESPKRSMPDAPGAVDERLDLGMVLDLAEP